MDSGGEVPAFQHSVDGMDIQMGYPATGNFEPFPLAAHVHSPSLAPYQLPRTLQPHVPYPAFYSQPSTQNYSTTALEAAVQMSPASRPPRQTIRISVVTPKRERNVYWVLFFLGVFFCPPFLLCGMLGICSSKESERLAGQANACALLLALVVVLGVLLMFNGHF